MAERWQDEVRRLQTLGPPSDLWTRVVERTPSADGRLPRRPGRLLATALAVLVAALGGVVVWRAFSSRAVEPVGNRRTALVQRSPLDLPSCTTGFHSHRQFSPNGSEIVAFVSLADAAKEASALPPLPRELPSWARCAYVEQLTVAKDEAWFISVHVVDVDPAKAINKLRSPPKELTISLRRLALGEAHTLFPPGDWRSLPGYPGWFEFAPPADGGVHHTPPPGEPRWPGPIARFTSTWYMEISAPLPADQQVAIMSSVKLRP